MIIVFTSSWAVKCCPGFCHVRVFTYLSVVNPKIRKNVADMVKMVIKFEKLMSFGGVFLIMEKFFSINFSAIDSTFG